MYPTSLSGNVLPDLQGEGEGEGRSAKALKLQYITNYLLLGVENDIYPTICTTLACNFKFKGQGHSAH